MLERGTSLWLTGFGSTARSKKRSALLRGTQRGGRPTLCCSHLASGVGAQLATGVWIAWQHIAPEHRLSARFVRTFSRLAWCAEEMDSGEEDDLFHDDERVVLARPVLNNITPILHWLIHEKLDHPEMVQFVEQGMLEQVSDLWFYFTEARPPSDPNVHRAWLASCESVHEGHSLLLDVVLASSAREATCSLPCRTMPKVTKTTDQGTVHLAGC